MSTSRILAFSLLVLGLIATACGDSSLDEASSEGLRIENGGLLSHPQEDEFCLSLVQDTHHNRNILYYAAERSGKALIWRAVQTESESDVYHAPESSRLSNVVGLAAAMIPSSSLEVMFYSTAERLYLFGAGFSAPLEVCSTNAEQIAGAQPLAVLTPSSICGPVSTGTDEIALLYAIGRTIYSVKFGITEITGYHPVLYRASEPIRTFSGEIASGGSFVPLSRIPALNRPEASVAEHLGLLFSVRTARGDYDILASDLNGRTIRLKQVNSLGNDRSPIFDLVDGSLYMVSDAFAPQLPTRSLNIFRWPSLVFDGDSVSEGTSGVSSSSASASSAGVSSAATTSSATSGSSLSSTSASSTSAGPSSSASSLTSASSSTVSSSAISSSASSTTSSSTVSSSASSTTSSSTVSSSASSSSSSSGSVIVVNFSNLLADGVSGSATTTTLYLKFDHDPVGLSLADITLTGASKVALTGSGRSRALTITGISVGNGGSVQVSLANPTGYVFAPTNSLTVPVFLDLLSPVEKREMVTVPGGTFTQTDTAGHDFSHTITGFKMGSYEVTYDLWYTVYHWALTQGYSFANPGCEGNSGTIGAAPTPSGKNQPVTTINWRDAIVWCNAYSQMAGLIPVYCSDSGLAIQDSGDANALQCDYPRVKWDATGYRLPTEGEWQYAASYRDGTLWTPYNYAAGATASYTDAAATKQVAWYSANSGNTTKPVGQKDDNELDIYDMSGNVWEWCWDWHAAYLTTAQNDYRGPASGSSRIRRGGGCNNNATDLQVGYRVDDEPTFKYNDIGFRLAQR